MGKPVEIEYLIEDVDSGQRMTKAYTVQVAVEMETREMLFASPDILFHKLGLQP